VGHVLALVGPGSPASGTLNRSPELRASMLVAAASGQPLLELAGPAEEAFLGQAFVYLMALGFSGGAARVRGVLRAGSDPMDDEHLQAAAEAGAADAVAMLRAAGVHEAGESAAGAFPGSAAMADGEDDYEGAGEAGAGTEDVVGLCDGSTGTLPSGSLPQSSINWRVQLAASSVAPVLLASRSRARLPAPELLWRWSLRTCLSPVAPIRKVGLASLAQLFSSVEKRALVAVGAEAAAAGSDGSISLEIEARRLLEAEAPSVVAMLGGNGIGDDAFPWVSALIHSIVQSMPEASAGAASGSGSTGPQSYGAATAAALLSSGNNSIERQYVGINGGYWKLLPAPARGTQIDAGSGGGRQLAVDPHMVLLVGSARVCLGPLFGRKAAAAAAALLKRAGQASGD